MYEFTEEQNKVIKQAATWALGLGIVEVIGGVLLLCTINLVSGPAYIITAVLLFMASASLNSVVNTQGNDIAHLMKAVDSLGYMLIIRAVLTAFLILWSLIGIAVNAFTLIMKM